LKEQKRISKRKQWFRKITRISGTIALAFVFCSKVLLLESGIFASTTYFQSQICECNHSSSRETHSGMKINPEDSAFQSNKIQLVSEPSKELPNCHSAKNNEVHKCSCSKKKNSSNLIQSQSMNPSFMNSHSFQLTHQLESSIAFASDSTNLLNGHREIPDEPPRN